MCETFLRLKFLMSSSQCGDYGVEKQPSGIKTYFMQKCFFSKFLHFEIKISNYSMKSFT